MNSKSTGLFLVLMISVLPLYTLSQVTVTLPVEQDAMVRYFGNQADPQNFGGYAYINMHAWTNGGTYVVHRSLMAYDLSFIGTQSEIVDATLKLYCDRYSTLYPNGHEQLYVYNPNGCVIQRIIEPWDEIDISWMNIPATDFTHEVHMPQSQASFQNYAIDVTDLVQDMINHPDSSFGFRIKLENEQPYNRMVFASSDHPNPELHPVLEVTFFTVGVNKPLTREFTICPNPADEKATIYLGGLYDGSPTTIQVTNSLGLPVRSFKHITGHQYQLKLQNWEEGIYLVSILRHHRLLASSYLVVMR